MLDKWSLMASVVAAREFVGSKETEGNLIDTEVAAAAPLMQLSPRESRGVSCGFKQISGG